MNATLNNNPSTENFPDTILRVLVVDDEEGMRLGVARTLENFTVSLPDVKGNITFVTDQAASGEDALESIAAHRPDILLLDHKMDDMSGLDVLERIGGEDQGILTIMITAYASLDTAITATKRGAYDFVTKPFTPDELRASLRKAVRHLMLQCEARRLAEEKRQVRFEFISVLAHELKSPLASIEGYLNIMKDRTQGDQLVAYDGMIERCAIRLEGMRKLIFDLLDMTRIESGLKKRHWEHVNLAERIALCVEMISPEAKQRGIVIERIGAGDVRMDGDCGELEIILNNLISNAVKYNRDGGEVLVEWNADDDRVTLCVKDSGIGMTSEEAGRLFGDFVRIKNAKTKNILGSGLGLSTVRKLARLYDGDVHVDSTPDKGSTFTVTLGRHTKPEA